MGNFCACAIFVKSFLEWYHQYGGRGVFYHFLPQRTLIVRISHRWECLCRSLELQQRSSSKLLEQKLSKIRDDKEGKRNSYKLTASPLPQGSTAHCQENFLSPWFLPRRKVRLCVSECYWHPPLCGMLSKRPIYFWPTQNLRCANDWRVERAGRTEARALRRHQWKTNERLSALGLAWWDWEKAVSRILPLPHSKREQEVWNLEEVWESLRISKMIRYFSAEDSQ